MNNIHKYSYIDTNYQYLDKLENLTVIKRNGKKVSFDETKIALSIKKGFDSVEVDIDDDDKERKYTTKDVQKVYQGFIDTVVQEVIDKTGNNPYSVPMDIYTTMDTSKQNVINNFYKTYKFKDTSSPGFNFLICVFKILGFLYLG